MPITKKKLELDLSAFPTGSVTEYSTLVCLACVFDIFTNQLGFAPRTAYSEIRKYSATIAELTAPKAVRPFFDSDDKQAHCPYCNAAKRWHARLETIRIEGSRATDAARRALLKKLPQKDAQFQLIETRSDKRAIFFEWLDTLVRNVDLDEEGWLGEATRAYLARLEPKTNWNEVFEELRAVRRSQRLSEGWEREGSRLFLAPPVYNEALIVQYLVSRSHVHGGQTMEGRLTLFELVRRLRYSGYLDMKELSGADQSETLDAIIDKIAGGQGKVKLYHIVDRREFLDKVKSVYARYAT
ncbi:MAG: hypothetical protein QOF62_521 [Pyrinomonadaceae bacterium]|jgi:hypothetical protein|nr:hypothetical protein [Pyrinomonadaceae bacterium]